MSSKEIPFLVTEIQLVSGNPKKSKRKPKYRIAPKYRVELVRESSIKVPERNLSRPSAVFNLAKQLIPPLDREVFYIITLNQKNNVIGVNLVSMGSLSASVVHPREVFKMAILQNAASVIAFHNHPSGITDPSPEDIELTRRLVEAGKAIGIQVLDHIIIGEDVYLSLMERYPELRG